MIPPLIPVFAPDEVTRLGQTWVICKTSDGERVRSPYYRQVMHSSDMGSVIVLVASTPGVIHRSKLFIATAEYMGQLEGPLRHTISAKKIPELNNLGYYERYIPECGLSFWTPFWVALSYVQAIQLVGVLSPRRPAKLCLNCWQGHEFFSVSVPA